MRAIKALGQNFLSNKHKVDQIVAYIQSFSPEYVCEIGPGQGALTLPLSAHVTEMVCVEKDALLAESLRTTLSTNNISNVNIICDDILKTDISAYFTHPYQVIGSLPYNISKRIVGMLLTSRDPRLTRIHVLIQKEVALKYTAQPPHSSYLSNFTQIYSTCSYAFSVSKTCFMPVPAVDGAVLTFIRKTPPPDHEDLVSFIKQIYSRPRKTVRNNLKAAGIDLKTGKPTDLDIDAVLSSRPSTLTLSHIQQLHIMYNRHAHNDRIKK